MILEQFDARLGLVKNLPDPSVLKDEIKQWKLDALSKFLSSLDDADKLSAHVSQVFNYADLLGIKSLMFSHDIPKILKLSHIRNWGHGEKWNDVCPMCIAEKSLNTVLNDKSILVKLN
jgi:hypothetical protein